MPWARSANIWDCITQASAGPGGIMKKIDDQRVVLRLEPGQLYETKNRMRKKMACALIMLLMFASCHRNQSEEINGLKNALFCVDGSENLGIYYKEIYSFKVNEMGEIFISNFSSIRIDAYDRHGAYQCSVGSKGDGPGEFHTGVSVFACTREKIIAFDISGKIIVFDKSGKLKKEKKISDIGISGHVLKILAFADRLILYLLDKKKYWVAILKSDLELDRLIATPIQDRKMPVRFQSDIDVDDHGNMYITDIYDYAIHVVDLNGKSVQSFKKEVKKSKFQKEDFVVFYDNEIFRHPASERLKGLEKKDKYWPPICGINVDRQRIYVWRTDLSENGECLVDVYDDKWNYLRGFYCGNGLAENFNFIKNNKVYKLSAKEPYSADIIRQLGKFGKMSMPDQVCVYPVPE